jgi:hypothetical protein
MISAIPAVTLYDAHIPWSDVYRKRMVLMMICTHADWFRNDDLDWVTRNYHVWEAFEREANKIWDRGRRHYSARTIIEVLRHESALREEENEHGWKINNDSAPSLARLYMLMYPERFGFFERRPGGSAQRAI